MLSVFFFRVVIFRQLADQQNGAHTCASRLEHSVLVLRRWGHTRSPRRKALCASYGACFPTAPRSKMLFSKKYCRRLRSGDLSLGSHPFSFRTRKLSPVEAMVVFLARVASRQNTIFNCKNPRSNDVGYFDVLYLWKFPKVLSIYTHQLYKSFSGSMFRQTQQKRWHAPKYLIL